MGGKKLFISYDAFAKLLLELRTNTAQRIRYKNIINSKSRSN